MNKKVKKIIFEFNNKKSTYEYSRISGKINT